MIIFLQNVLQLFGVVFFRFRRLPRLWGIWFVGVNLACLLFITHIEAQILLVVTSIAVAGQALIHQRIGFTRLLGVTHLLWVPMFAWMATRIDAIANEPRLLVWLVLLFVTNLVSLVIDAIDTTRFIRGERAPHYRWKLTGRS